MLPILADAYNCVDVCPNGECYCWDVYLPDGWIVTAIFGLFAAWVMFRAAVYFIRTLPFT